MKIYQFPFILLRDLAGWWIPELHITYLRIDPTSLTGLQPKALLASEAMWRSPRLALEPLQSNHLVAIAQSISKM
jgi:hypothetical protein